MISGFELVDFVFNTELDAQIESFTSLHLSGGLEVIYPELDINKCLIIPKHMKLREKVTTVWKAPQIYFSAANKVRGVCLLDFIVIRHSSVMLLFSVFLFSVIKEEKQFYLTEHMYMKLKFTGTFVCIYPSIISKQKYSYHTQTKASEMCLFDI